ncbi:MAG: cation acetate symporter [Ideonella sp.]|nr:cation acetate symporter [Ideonella sp.]MBL0148216.1 cation acetate symporter [Ideonella sp.]
MAIDSPPPGTDTNDLARQQWQRHRVHWRFGLYVLALLVFVGVMAVVERLGLPRAWIAAVFLLAPVALYASVGLACRTTNTAQYFVAGRSVPAIYNGMAIGADWMSVASFMGLAGLLYANGYGGLAYVLGWTGGFCLVGLYVAPYLRKFGQYTIPDFLGERYGSRLPRLIAVIVTVLCSLMYVVAQIYGVGLITSRLTGFTFEIGVFLGLGGILVCSFLGGMRAVTWTQVTQYVILAVAFLVPVVWLSVKQTGIPLPHAAVGQQLKKVTARERELLADPREQEVRALFQQETARYNQMLRDPAQSLAQERGQVQRQFSQAARAGATQREVRAAERAWHQLPKDADAARETWTRARDAAEDRSRPLAGMPPQAQLFAGDPNGDAQQRTTFDDSRLNFLALVFCLMAGTAGLPHILARFYTTPTVREARQSVTWAVLFIVLIYITAPTLAVLLKFEVLNSVVGLRFDQLPRWVTEWSKVDPLLLSVVDINGDGVLQLGEMRINGDIMVLATPEIGGMPFVLSCLVAAGALAAALSTADGLLLTTANALSHDLYFKIIDPGAPTNRRVTISKVVLLVVAMLAAYIATRKPAEILLLVTPVFSVAAATIFPALVLGAFWKRANASGASAGMLVGLAVTLYYLATRHPSLRALTLQTGPVELWWGVQSASAGVFGVPAAFLANVMVSLITRANENAVGFVDEIRMPDGE